MSDESIDGLRAEVAELRQVVEDVRGLAAALYERSAGWAERLVAIRETDGWRRAYTEPEPLVSVRISTCDRADLLMERAIASVLRQTYANWEVNVVGDACTDDTEQRIAALGDPRIRFRNLPVRGPYPDDPYRRWLVAGIPAQRAATEMSRGLWIAPLDDDDEWDDDHIEVLLNAARENGAELAYGKMRVRIEEPPIEAMIGRWPPSAGEIGMQGAIYNGALNAAGFQYDRVGGFMREPSDWHFARRLWDAGVRFHFLDRPVGVWHRKNTEPVPLEWFLAHAVDR
jgi:glycosyltransferase involved in cell wall biosynthesis